MIYGLYRALTAAGAPLLNYILKRRLIAGKESPARFTEKKAVITQPRPGGKLVWLHAASVGEAQSALILIDRVLRDFPEVNILITTGTLTSANLMEQKLPHRAFHQFYPLDHPKWVRRFLDHWQPDVIFWMESELWPNMIANIKQRQIPAFLINARMSQASFKKWRKVPSLSKMLLSAFDCILCQTEQDAAYYESLGGKRVVITDNLKYSAYPLSYDRGDYDALKCAVQDRPLWLYASTHQGEEEIACNIHKGLKEKYPDILSIIVPRHPERRDEIQTGALQVSFRGEDKTLPRADDDIYIADTLGELGLFYALSPIAVIGRSFSDDGGGGHNPIEAAQLDCVVLHGPGVHNLQEIFDDMDQARAAYKALEPKELEDLILSFLDDPEKRRNAQMSAKDYSLRKTSVIEKVMDILMPTLKEL